MNRKYIVLIISLTVLLGGCFKSQDIQKQIFEHYDAILKENGALNNYKRSAQTTVIPSTAWLKSIKPEDNVTFVSYRTIDKNIFCVVLDCNVTQNEIVLYPIGDNRSPVGIVMNPEYRKEFSKLIEDYHNETLDKRTNDKIIRADLSQSIADKMYGSPIPVSNQVFAVAMNFSSHIERDLAFDFDEKSREIMGKAAPRVFFKYPPVAPPVQELKDKKNNHDSFLGAYDTIKYDEKIFIPSDDPALSYKTTDLKLDYEVEVGVVIGKQIRHETLQTMSDEEIYSLIAGYVLVSDVKARNPQVMLKIINHNEKPDSDNAYSFQDATLNNVFGSWTEQTCAWWSYASTCNNFLSVGPFFVTAQECLELNEIPILAARSYGNSRDEKSLKKYLSDTLYLRQSTVVTESKTHNHALIWNLPQIVREIVRPDNPLASVAGEKIILMPGDIICLGTPSGVALTSKPYPLFNFLKNLLFWMKPNQWHDMFFKGHQTEYLYPSDRVFMWGEKLGYQHLNFELKK